MAFWLSGLDPAPYAPLFSLDDQALRRHGARRVMADSDTGYPCRVSLEDARAGEVLLLLPYEHLPAPSPYRACGPVFVRQGARRRTLAPGHVPAYLSRRLVSLRAYDAGGMMRAADVADGTAIAGTLTRMFADPAVGMIHLHNARHGCYLCLAGRG